MVCDDHFFSLKFDQKTKMDYNSINRTMKRSYLLGGVLLALGGCGHEATEPAQAVQHRTIHNIEVEKAKLYKGTNALQYSGLVEAKQSTPLSFKTPGTVIEIRVEEGQYVKKGQLLARLDASNAQSSYELALQKQQQAQDAYNRMKPMHENETLPEIKWVEVETGLSQATTATEMAQRRIGDAALHAPRSGVIGTKYIQPGMNVLPSAAAFDLLDINSVYVNIPVPESEVGALQAGQSASIEIAAVNESRTGQVQHIGVVANPVSHTYPVKILVSNEAWLLKPGMVCKVSIAAGRELNGIAVSNKALQRDATGQQYVYVLQDSTVTVKPVQTLDLVRNQVIVSDLQEGELVVVSGQHKLTEGVAVNVVNKIN